MRKDNSNNPLQISLRAVSIPKGVSPKRYYQRLIQHITEGREIPSSWDVQIGWRNPKTRAGRTRNWQFDDFQDAIADSRAGFVSLVHQALVRRLRRLM